MDDRYTDIHPLKKWLAYELGAQPFVDFSSTLIIDHMRRRSKSRCPWEPADQPQRELLCTHSTFSLRLSNDADHEWSTVSHDGVYRSSSCDRTWI